MPDLLLSRIGTHPPPYNAPRRNVYSMDVAPTSDTPGFEGDVIVTLTEEFYKYVSGVWTLMSIGGAGGGAGLTYYQTGALDPNGSVTGSVGDVFHSRVSLGGDGSTWWKVSGNATNTGWE